MGSNKNDTFFTGTGVVSVTTGPANYTAWTANNGASANLQDDHDNDGVQNGIEYFLTGNEVKYTFPAVPAKTFARLVITPP
jgi:hypothetical protein